MTEIYLIFASVFIISLVSLIGVLFLSVKDSLLKKITHGLVALAIGSMLAGATLHIIPELFAESPDSMHFNLSLLILTGIIGFLSLERFLHWHHNHKIHDQNKELCLSCNQEKSNDSANTKPVGKMVLISDALHNILDGSLIAGAFLISPQAGIAASFAILMHEIPQEISDFGVLIHSGFSKSKALVWNFVSAITAFLGVFFTLFAYGFSQKSAPYIAAFAAGAMLYIAMADLIPELHKHKKGTKETFAQFAMIFAGIFIMVVLKLYFE